MDETKAFLELLNPAAKVAEERIENPPRSVEIYDAKRRLVGSYSSHPARSQVRHLTPPKNDS